MTAVFRRSVCVFCGSRPGLDPAHVAEARALGRALAAAGLRLVYGAGDVGLMGALAAAAAEAGGATLGVVPRHLIAREAPGRDRGAVGAGIVVTETMHERKKVMFMNADAIVALPGGPGTLDELFEVLTWRQLDLHRKPVYVLNVNGYWAPLLALIDHLTREGFADCAFRGFLEPVDTVRELTEKLRTLAPMIDTPSG
jgi:uncharacterized protein (TIGR00730 family)